MIPGPELRRLNKVFNLNYMIWMRVKPMGVNRFKEHEPLYAIDRSCKNGINQ